MFTTGTNTAGYTLTSVVVELYPKLGRRQRSVPTVTLNNVTLNESFRHAGDSGGHADHYGDGGDDGVSRG